MKTAFNYLRSVTVTSVIGASLLASAAMTTPASTSPFNYKVDRFADIEVLRYKVPGFEQLSLNQKLLIYYLTEAAIAGRDIVWDQNGKYNLAMRSLMEQLYASAKKSGDNSNEFKALEKYLKQIEFANGIHHHYSSDKFTPEFSEAYLDALIAASKVKISDDQLAIIKRLLFDPAFMAKRVNQAAGQDLVVTSANNLYDGVTQAEVEKYFASRRDSTDRTPVSLGLNTRVTKDAAGNVIEQTYRQGGLYDAAITRIINNLTEAAKYAENDTQRNVINTLIEYYRTGDLKKFDEYSILWVGDTASRVDFINGFIETYGDPLDMTGTWESIVNFKNLEASHRTEAISNNAQWFEDHSPVDPRFRKPEVKGVTAKVITAAILAGDSYPSTPIGINLPNANWIRAAHGSKSVTLENITQAYDEASHGNGFNAEFVIDAPTSELMDKYLFITDNLHTDLHECLGHASGRLLPGVDENALGVYGSALEETRADLFALYYLADPKLIELGLLDNPEAYKAEYYKYMLNGLMTQLMRIEPGKEIEEAHMRNRALIARWALEKGAKDNVVELVTRDGKTFVKINDYEGLRSLFAQLLAEIQRIKSEGDFEAGKALIENYGVKVDPTLHKEVLDRYAHLNIAPYKGFVNPVYTLVKDKKGNVTDVTITYGEDFLPQVLRYSKDYSTLK